MSKSPESANTDNDGDEVLTEDRSKVESAIVGVIVGSSLGGTFVGLCAGFIIWSNRQSCWLVVTVV